MIVSTASRQIRRRTVLDSRRLLSTEHVSSESSPSAPPVHQSQSHAPASKSRSRLMPQPRPPSLYRHQVLPNLPPTFGRNQLLPVSNTTRALLESVVAQFQAPIRYAFAYGSGVFEQDGYANKGDQDRPMLDFIFAVTHPGHWHSINLQQNPSHYPLHARTLGSDFISRVQEVGPGVWFNAYVVVNGHKIKYGVITVDNLCSDLLNWRSLYLAGRMHKPLRIIKDDARVRLTQQVNLTSAVRTALLTLPATFTEEELFLRIAGLSYSGDPRMLLPAENRSKVANIVSRQSPQFHELYYRLATGLPGVHWPLGSNQIQQDDAPGARAAHLKKLPSNLLKRVQNQYADVPGIPSRESDESAYWSKIAGDARLAEMINQEIGNIVRYPATIQSLKGVVTAGLGKTIQYSSAKVKKWWKGGSGKKTSSSSS